DAYTRYLTQTFRKAFHLQGTPLRIQYNVNKNPYDEKDDKPARPLRRVKLSNRIAKREQVKQSKKQVKRKNKVSSKKTNAL
ncbi:MAG: ribosome biogenesis GTPase Der, partial [Snodgrassella sp.]|nr:ribosome biogenesis GTPase Der [Snodgrassella sp.]